MKITIDQDEIEEAVEAFIRRQIAINDDQTITIEFTAGRGANGLTAALDISSRPRPASASAGMPNPMTKTQTPFVSKRVVEEEPEPEEEAPRKTRRKPFFNAEATVEETEEAEAEKAPEAKTEETSGVILENQAQDDAEEEPDETPEEASEEPAPKKLRSTKSIFSKAS